MTLTLAPALQADHHPACSGLAERLACLVVLACWCATLGWHLPQAGNRTSANESGQVSQPTFDGENRHVSYGFDASGNVTTGVANQGIWNYAYDAQGQLLTATPSGATTPTARFVYDPRGRVCQRTVGGVTTNLYYAGSQLLEEDDAANGARGCSYIYGAGGERADRLGADYSSTFYHYDGRGFVTHLSDSGGHGVEQYLYDAYGQPYVYDAGSGYRGQASAVYNNRSVWAGGYEWYPELGLYRCGARFYDPTCAHWLQPDPLGQAGGLNLYAYCHNDPINATDPSGLADPNHLDETPKKNYDFADPGMASLFGAQKGDQIGISSFGVQYSSGHWQDVPDTGGSSKDGRVTIIGHDPIWIANTSSFTLSTGIVVNPTIHVSLRDGISFTNPGNWRSYYWYRGNYRDGAARPDTFAQKGEVASWNPFALRNARKEFHKGGSLDAQALENGNASPSYGNYVFGVFMERAGFNLNGTLLFAESAAPSSYATAMPFDSTHARLPQANVNAITSGWNDAYNDTIWSGN